MSARDTNVRNAEQPIHAATKSSAAVTPERIQARAYEIFLARNGGDGDALADWLQAERELNGSGLPADAEGNGSKSKQRAGSSSTDSKRRHS